MLWVFKENLKACKFYEMYGFVLTEKYKYFSNTIKIMYYEDL